MNCEKLDEFIKSVDGDGPSWEYTWYPKHNIIRINVSWLVKNKYNSEEIDVINDLSSVEEKVEIIQEEMAEKILTSLKTNNPYKHVYSQNDLPKLSSYNPDENKYRKQLDNFFHSIGKSDVYWKSGINGNGFIWVLATMLEIGQHYECFKNDHTEDIFDSCEEIVAKQLYEKLNIDGKLNTLYKDEYTYGI